MPSSRNRIRLINAALAFGLLLAAQAHAATPPYVRLEAAVGTTLQPVPGCSPQDPAPALAAAVDLGPSGSYRYSPAWLIPFYFDDEGEFNLLYNSDAILEVSPYFHTPRVETNMVLPTTPLASWLGSFGRIPDHSPLAMRVVAYDDKGASVSISRITWDCTTGEVLTLEQRGNAAGEALPAAIPLVEFHHAGLDHYFASADATETAALDSGAIAGWVRTGYTFDVFPTTTPGTSPVCRYYLPPAYGDSHFFSASPDECEVVHSTSPAFVRESANAYYIGLPDTASGTCPAGAQPVYRLWNNRRDSNHRYTTDPLVKAEMIAKGFVAEGYGPDAVSMCASR